MMSSIMPYIIDDGDGNGEFEEWLRNNPMPTRGIDNE